MTRHRSKGQGSLFKRNGKKIWMMSWYDHDGRRQEKSTRTTDKAAAQRILNKHVADAALRREGVIDAGLDRLAREARRPFQDHVDDYIRHCHDIGLDARHIHEKRDHLRRFIAASGVHRLSDMAAGHIERHMRRLIEQGLSARTANFARQQINTFANWCVAEGRLGVNPGTRVAKLDERHDRRRVRRPLTDDELDRLIMIARARGREAWYLTAALTGLRKGEMQDLRWKDVDLNTQVITVRNDKGVREDLIAIHAQLQEVLRELKKRSGGRPRDKVFPKTVTDLTRKKDLLRAGIAREVEVRDEQGQVVMVGTGKRRRPKTRIETVDEAGREVDLHSLRTTLGTNLARAGVAPQVAQRVMRHTDYRTTLKHYTVLGLADTSRAVQQLPGIGLGHQTRCENRKEEVA